MVYDALMFKVCVHFLFSFSSEVVGKVQHGRLSKYFFDDLEEVYPAGKVVTAKILRSLALSCYCTINVGSYLSAVPRGCGLV